MLINNTEAVFIHTEMGARKEECTAVGNTQILSIILNTIMLFNYRYKQIKAYLAKKKKKTAEKDIP